VIFWNHGAEWGEERGCAGGAGFVRKLEQEQEKERAYEVEIVSLRPKIVL
jgi:hypothetical protein